VHLCISMACARARPLCIIIAMKRSFYLDLRPASSLTMVLSFLSECDDGSSKGAEAGSRFSKGSRF
jgi:hypothetical protein